MNMRYQAFQGYEEAAKISQTNFEIQIIPFQVIYTNDYDEVMNS